MAPLRLVGFACGALGVVAQEIKPSLSPASHKKFFGKDYPDDLRPSIDAAPKWSYPYPKVQSDSKYDTDYVKDENNDGGHWKAQMDYDELKMKYVKQQAIVRAAALKEGLEKDEAMKAAGIKDKVWLKKQSADAESSKASEDAAIATGELDAATKEEQAKEWEAAKKAGKSKEVFEAEQKVDQAELHLKDCQKVLDDAKAELEKVVAAAAANEAANQGAKDANVQAAKGKQAGKAGDAQSKKAALSDKQAKAAAAAKEADTAKSAADKEHADEETAHRTLEQEQTRLAKLATDLEEAEKRLRKFRGDYAHAAELHAEGTHSGAKQVSAWSLVLAMAGLAAIAA